MVLIQHLENAVLLLLSATNALTPIENVYYNFFGICGFRDVGTLGIHNMEYLEL